MAQAPVPQAMVSPEPRSHTRAVKRLRPDAPGVRIAAVGASDRPPVEGWPVAPSMEYRAKQRLPFPHLARSEPPALTIRIFRSAALESRARMAPALPAPKCRSLMGRQGE